MLRSSSIKFINGQSLSNLKKVWFIFISEKWEQVSTSCSKTREYLEVLEDDEIWDKAVWSHTDYGRVMFQSSCSKLPNIRCIKFINNFG